MTMTRRNSDNELAFCVVQFTELPFEGIDDYVCVPHTWLTAREATDQTRATVAYPEDENPFDTRDRAERKERYNDEWKRYMAIVKYESNSYNDAEFWITTRNDYGPLVEEKSKVTGTQPKLSINKKLRSANQNHLSKSNNNSRKPVPRTIKRPAQLELKEELDGKRLKVDECTHSSNAAVNGVQESRNSVAPSKDTINDNQETHTDDFSNELNSQKISAHLTRLMNEGRRLVVKKESVVERTILPETTVCLSTVTTSPQKLSNSMDRTISSSTSSVEQLPVVTQCQSRDSLGDQTFKRLQQKQLQPTQQDSQRQLQKPKIHIGISLMQKNNWQAPTLQGVTKKTLSPILTKVDSGRKAALTSHINYLLNNQQFQARPSDSVLVNDSSLPKVMSNACQPEKCMIDETLSPYHAATSDSDAAMDEKVISNHEMSPYEAPAETTNNVYGTANDPGHSSADRPTAAQNSTARSRHRNPRRKKLFQFVLPPEYDANNSRWTLMYPKYLRGLVELVPESHVYVSRGDLNHCRQVSKDCPSLARRLLTEVFNRNALSVCSSMIETAKASTIRADTIVGSNIRPDLDDYACSTLLNFVIEHGLQHGWNTDLKPIFSMLHSKIQEIRFKYGVMVEVEC